MSSTKARSLVVAQGGAQEQKIRHGDSPPPIGQIRIVVRATAHLQIYIDGGVVITSSITNEAVGDLGLAVDDESMAMVRASDVMVTK